MTYIKYQGNFVFDMIKRMWCMMFHKHEWQPHSSNTHKCKICGEEFDD